MYPSSFTYQGTLTIYRNCDCQIAVLENVPFEEVEYRFRKRVRAYLRHQKSARMYSLEGFSYKYVRKFS